MASQISLHRIKFIVPMVLLASFLSSYVFSESLHGRVVERSSLSQSAEGIGIPGVKLALYNVNGKKIAIKTTSKLGAYHFSNIPEGRYTVEIEHSSYFPRRTQRSFTLGDVDHERSIYLDKVPLKQGLPNRIVSMKKGETFNYYHVLAEGMLRSDAHDFYREHLGKGEAKLSRFYLGDEDTTASYRSLWISLLWAEIESQNKPIESIVFLAQALDSTLKVLGWPAFPAFNAYKSVSPDSVESLNRALKTMLLTSSKKSIPLDFPKFKVPKAIVLAMIEGKLESKQYPLNKRKAFLSSYRKLLGAASSQRMAENLSPKKSKKRDAVSLEDSIQIASNELWTLVGAMSNSKKTNPVALRFLAEKHFEEGRYQEAMAAIAKAMELRPGYEPLYWIRAQCKIALGNSLSAQQDLDTLKRSESPQLQARAYQTLGELYWRANRPVETQRMLWQAIGLESNTLAGRKSLYLLAEAGLSSDTGSAIINLLETLLTQRPKEAEAYYWIGRQTLQHGNSVGAVEKFRKAILLNPTKVIYSEAMAKAYLQTDQLAGALRVLNPLRNKLSVEGEQLWGQCLISTGNAKIAVKEFSVRYSKAPSAKRLALWAKALIQSRDPNQAVKVIQGSAYANDFEIRMTLAEAKLALNLPLEARSLLEPLAAEQPGNSEIIFALGRSAFLQRDYLRASQAFTQTLQEKPNHWEAFYQQGMSLLKQGRSGEAHTYFKELMARPEKSWQGKGLLGNGLAFFQENNRVEAEKILRLAFSLSPTVEAAAHLSMLTLRTDTSNGATVSFKESAQWSRKATQLDPSNHLALMSQVDILMALEREGDAVYLADSALDKHRQSCDFLVVAAKAHLRADDDSVAQVLSTRAHDKCPTEPAPFYFLGSLSARAGAGIEARRHFDSYVRTGGDIRRVPEAYR